MRDQRFLPKWNSGGCYNRYLKKTFTNSLNASLARSLAIITPYKSAFQQLIRMFDSFTDNHLPLLMS